MSDGSTCPGLYILDDAGNPVPCEETLKWGAWMAKHDGRRRVAQTDLGNRWVSTVFLGIDHNLCEDGPPLVFETMVFQKSPHESDLYMDRYSTREEALKGHERIVEMVRAKPEAESYYEA